MSIIFSSGTCKRGEFYDLLISEMIAKGWQDVSSYHEYDGNVMYSTGTLGNNSLYIQLLPYPLYTYPQSVANYAAANIRTTANNVFTVRYPMTYIPGAANVGGTLGRTGSYNCISLINGSNSFSAENKLDYDLYVDKNKVIFVTKPSDFFSKYAQVAYFGQPDTQFTAYLGGRGCVTASSNYYGIGNGLSLADYPDSKLGTNGALVTGYFAYSSRCPFPNVNEVFFLQEPYYYETHCGMIGKLDGLYFLGLNTQYKHGDIIKVGNNRFKLINGTFQSLISGYSSSFSSSPWLAIQVQ